MENTRIHQALKGVRGRKPVDLGKLEELLVRFSELVIENPRIADIEINPLLAGADTLVALDARVILHPATTKDAALPRPAIRPYPSQYVSQWQEFTIRPIRPDDEPLVVDFHHQLSERSVYLRYFFPLKLDFRVSHERLINKCFIDYDRELALVAEYEVPPDETSVTGTEALSGKRIAGIARLVRNHSDDGAEVAFLVADKYQNRGLGTYLLERIIEIAKLEGITSLQGAMLAENVNMQDLFVRVGFHFSPPQEGTVTATLDLGG
jgi:acetyltransferase